MTTINLRDYYYWYTQDEFVEVPDEVAAALLDAERLERNYTERVRYNKAYYSLDVGDGIENEVCYINLSPTEIYERQLMRCRVCRALNFLSEKQGRRIDAHYMLRKSVCEIAETEGVAEARVYESIMRGIKNMKNYLEKFDWQP